MPGSGETAVPGTTEREGFLAVRYWPALDGLRAVSILLVVLFHTTDPVWQVIDGRMGVTLFFVISGFLITTLLLREEERRGRVSLRGFYIRRIFRIAPLYYLALGATLVLVLAMGVGERTDGFTDKLPLLATFNGEFSGPGTFMHSWSLGIEEKFYLAWPLLGFAFVPLAARRLPILMVLTPVTFAASYVPGLGYLGIYFPIIAGCLLAALAHDPTRHRVWTMLTARITTYLTLTLLVVLFFADGHLPTERSNFAHSPFAVGAVLALPGLISSETRVRDALGNPWLVRIGMRAYAIYLFHPGVIQFADALVAPGQDALAPQGVRLLMIMGGSVLVAEVLCRFVEAPCIRLGRRLAAEGPRTQPTDKGGDPEPPLGVQSVPAPRKPLTGQRSGVSRIWQRGRDLNPR